MYSPRSLRLWLAVIPLLLAACETINSIDFNPEPELPPPCPDAVVAEGAGRLTRFAGAGREPTDVAFEAEVYDLTGTCGYDDESIDVELNVTIVASRGPAASGSTASLNYFVAVARTDKTILARQAFDTSVELPEDGSRNGVVDEIEQTISLPEGATGENYVIIVGIEMSPEELEFSRQQDR